MSIYILSIFNSLVEWVTFEPDCQYFQDIIKKISLLLLILVTGQYLRRMFEVVMEKSCQDRPVPEFCVLC